MENETNATVEGGEVDVNTSTENNQEGQDVKTYTQEEYDKGLQAEADRRVTEALKTAQTKWQSEFEKKLENEKNQAARLAKMTADEKAAELAKQEREAYEADKAKFNSERLEFETTKQLAEKQLPVAFASMLCKDDAETTKANIETFEKEFLKAVQLETEKRLKGKTPNLGTQANTKITQEQFNKMSYDERLNLNNENKAEYDRLIGGI